MYNSSVGPVLSSQKHPFMLGLDSDDVGLSANRQVKRLGGKIIDHYPRLMVL